MDQKQRNLESLRRVVDRLRKIGDDSFSANLAKALEQEMSSIEESEDNATVTNQQTTVQQS